MRTPYIDNAEEFRYQAEEQLGECRPGMETALVSAVLALGAAVGALRETIEALPLDGIKEAIDGLPVSDIPAAIDEGWNRR